MNVIQLCGGLGNQLFQYAFGQLQMGNGIDVGYNTSWFNKYKETRPYRLDKFNTNLKLSPYLKQKTIIEKSYDAGLLKAVNCNFNGYWQYLAYFVNILPVLQKEFCVREEYHTKEYLHLRDKITAAPSVSIHVRRGDYLGSDSEILQIMPLSYYFEALQYTKGDLYIFSDDMTWCKENFSRAYFSRKVTFVQLTDYLDFELMKLCDHNIISRSTFSWWPAILNDNPKKIVVAPKLWVIKKIDLKGYNNKIHYPKEWIKI